MHFRNSILEVFGLNIKENLYIAPYFYENQPDGSVNIFYPSFIAIILDLFTIGALISVACYYGVKCYSTLRKFTTTVRSKKYNLLQNQLYYSLVTQTAIPVILMHIPASSMFISTFLDINIGSLSGIVTVSIALFPAIDPFPTILIVKNYRNALKSYFTSFLRVIVEKLESGVKASEDMKVQTV